MKRNYINKRLWLLLAFTVIFFSCGDNRQTVDQQHAHAPHGVNQYTCPMHPQIVQDEPGSCPICGMDLVPRHPAGGLGADSNLAPLLKPVKEQVISNAKTIRPGSGYRIFNISLQGVVTYDNRNKVSVASRVAGRIEQMIVKYNYQPIQKGQLILEIYSPELAAAQRELIYISASDGDPALLDRAKQRLRLLGMQAAQIERVIQTGSPLYRVPVYAPASGYIVEQNSNNPMTSSQPPQAAAPAPSGGMGGMSNSGTTPSATTPQLAGSPLILRQGQYVSAGETLFTIYNDDRLLAEFYFSPALEQSIRLQQKLLFHPEANRNALQEGRIGLIEPTQKSGNSFSTARVFLRRTSLKPGQLLEAWLPIVKTNAYWLPQQAILDLGSKTIVYKKEGAYFVPKVVTTGIRTNGVVEIADSIAHWEVAENAGFMVDPESLLRLTQNQPKP